MKGITYCGACADYDIKKHRCKRGAKLESNPQDKFFDDCPLPDAAPVVHGKDLAQPSLFKCSVCGCEDDDTYTCDVSEYRFCPNCGAKIDEKAKPEPSVVTIYKCSGCGTRFMEFSKRDYFCCFCGAKMDEEEACEADIEKTT